MIAPLVASLVLAGAESSTAPSTRAAEWQLALEGDVHIWTREQETSDFDELIARTEIDAPAPRVWSVLLDVTRYPTFMPYVVEMRVIARIDEKLSYIYQRVDPPIIDARDWIMRVVDEAHREKRLWTRRFRIVPFDRAPPRPAGTIRLEKGWGTWSVKRLSEQKTELVYQVFTEPLGWIPSWVANRIQTMAVPKLMRAIRARVMDQMNSARPTPAAPDRTTTHQTRR